MENIKRIRELVAELNELLGPEEAPRMVGTCRVGIALADAVNNGEVGFKGGWISSTQFDALLEGLEGEPVMPIDMRRAWLVSNGYVQHPACPGVLYVTTGHWSLRLTEAIVVAGAYEEAQQ